MATKPGAADNRSDWRLLRRCQDYRSPERFAGPFRRSFMRCFSRNKSLDMATSRSTLERRQGDGIAHPEEGWEHEEIAGVGGSRMRSKLHAVYGVWIVQRSGLR